MSLLPPRSVEPSAGSGSGLLAQLELLSQREHSLKTIIAEKVPPQEEGEKG